MDSKSFYLCISEPHPWQKQHFLFVPIREDSWAKIEFPAVYSVFSIVKIIPMLKQWTGNSCVVIGMLHLPALPGSPLFAGNLKKIRDLMLSDADTLARGGVHGLMIENFGDVPFFKTQVPAHVVAHMTAIAASVKEKFDLPLGINCLRNDGCSALSIAHAVGAEYIRVNVLSGARVTDQGVIEGISADLMRLRSSLKADHIKVMADVDVKHSAPLGPIKLEDEVDDVIERGLAEGLIVSGAGTGKATDPAKAARVRAQAPRTPLFVGSGITAASIEAFLPHITGVIVGTYFKKNGRVDQPVDIKRVKELVANI